MFAITIVLMLAFGMIGCKQQETPVFEVDDFELVREENNYSITYEGHGELVTDAEGMYRVIVERIRKKGGNPDLRDKLLYNIIVKDGEGKIFTYEYLSKENDDDDMEEPKYKFKIIGYIPVTEIADK